MAITGMVRLKSKILPASAWAPNARTALDKTVRVAGFNMAGRALQREEMKENGLEKEGGKMSFVAFNIQKK